MVKTERSTEGMDPSKIGTIVASTLLWVNEGCPADPRTTAEIIFNGASLSRLVYENRGSFHPRNTTRRLRELGMLGSDETAAAVRVAQNIMGEYDLPGDTGDLYEPGEPGDALLQRALAAFYSKPEGGES